MRPGLRLALAGAALLSCLSCAANAAPDAPAVTRTETTATPSNPTTAPASPNPAPAANHTAPPVGHTPAPQTPTDAADPDAIALAVVAIINRQDTTTDASPRDALRRAGTWMTPSLLAHSLSAPLTGDASWSQLAAHRGYTAVDQIALANETGQPENTDTDTYAQITYRLRYLGRDGWNQTDPTRNLARIHLTRPAAGGPWRVAEFLGAQ